MKKKITYIAFTLFISALFSTQAAENNNLEIVITQAAMTGQKEVSAYVHKTKTYEPKASYDYKFYCLLKNIGETDVVVATKGLGSTILNDGKGEVITVRLSFDKSSYKGSPIIPSESDLGLVLLHPNESAEIKWEQSAFTLLSQMRVQYNPTDTLAKRFKCWAGSITGEPVEVMVPKK
jgi:hypothetical protein